MKRAVLLTACVFVGLGLLSAAGPKPPADSPVKFILLDRPGDAITSDGKGPYINGVDGVTAVLEGATKGNNFLLKFSTVKGKFPRTLTYNYTGVAGTPCDADTSDNPTGTRSDYNFVDFLDIATMPIGATTAKQGGFHTAVGVFRFHDATKPTPVNPYHCGALLVITRNGATTWTVTTDTVAGQTYYTAAGNPVYTENPQQVGNLTQLDNAATGEFYGNYRMPFFATISCLSASACPAGGS